MTRELPDLGAVADYVATVDAEEHRENTQTALAHVASCATCRRRMADVIACASSAINDPGVSA